MKRPLFLFLFLAVLYASGRGPFEFGDTAPSRYLPISLVRELNRELNFDLDEFPVLYDGEFLPYFMTYREPHYVSAYPVGSALLATPVYAFPVLLGGVSSPGALMRLEHLAAALIAAASALLLYLAARRLLEGKAAVLVTLAYALGTSTFSVSSQALWQHGPSQLFVALGLYLLVRGLMEPRHAAYSGFAFASAVVCRPTNLLIVLTVAAYVLFRHRDQFWRFVAFGMPPALFLAGYNRFYFGSFLESGYSWAISHFYTPFGEGLLGLLISPSRGLFVYSPVFLLSLIGAWRAFRGRGEEHVLMRFLAVGAASVILLHSRWGAWWGGHSYGPRLLADLTPLLTLLLVPFWKSTSGLGQYTLRAIVVLSIMVHALGAFLHDGAWDAKAEERPELLWSWVGSPIPYHARELMDRGRQAFARAATTARGLPDSLHADLLSASLRREPVPGRVSVAHSFDLTVRAQNTGRAVWLSRQGRGMVGLGWRWWRVGAGASALEGRAPLPYDILPGGAHAFRPRIHAPSEPGEYELEFGMVSEGMIWFLGSGMPSPRANVKVLYDPERNFLDVVNGSLAHVKPDSRLLLRVDRASYRGRDHLRLMISGENREERAEVDVYLALLNPDGILAFVGSRGRSTYAPGGPWVPLARNFRLVGGYRLADYLVLVQRVDALAPGSYIWYLALARAGTRDLFALSTAGFSVEKP